MQHQAETLTLYNDGQVPCQFEFIQKPNESTYCKPWLTANPPKGFIAQGSCHVKVTFIVWSHEFFLSVFISLQIPDTKLPQEVVIVLRIAKKNV